MKVEVSSFVAKQVAVVFFGQLHALTQGLGVVAEDERGDVEAHELLQRGEPRLVAQGLQICALDAAYELEPLGVKIVVKARQLEGGAVDVRGVDPRAVKVLRGVQDGEALLLDYALQADGIFLAHHCDAAPF